MEGTELDFETNVVTPLEELEELREDSDVSMSQDAYDVAKDVIRMYMDGRKELIYDVEELCSDAMTYYADCWDYLRDNDIVEWQPAINDGCDANLSDIARFFLEREVESVLSRLNIDMYDGTYD